MGGISLRTSCDSARTRLTRSVDHSPGSIPLSRSSFRNVTIAVRWFASGKKCFPTSACIQSAHCSGSGRSVWELLENPFEIAVLTRQISFRCSRNDSSWIVVVMAVCSQKLRIPEFEVLRLDRRKIRDTRGWIRRVCHSLHTPTHSIYITCGGHAYPVPHQLSASQKTAFNSRRYPTEADCYRRLSTG